MLSSPGSTTVNRIMDTILTSGPFISSRIGAADQRMLAAIFTSHFDALGYLLFRTTSWARSLHPRLLERHFCWHVDCHAQTALGLLASTELSRWCTLL